MITIDEDFVYNKYPKTEHDIHLLDEYKAFLANATHSLELTCISPSILNLFPVHEGICENAPFLSRWGLMALSIDQHYMNDHYRPWCRILTEHILPDDFFDSDTLRRLRSSLIEFAMLGCMEAQRLMHKLDTLYGDDDAYIENIVNERCPSLKKFINAHEGSGRGVNPDDVVSSYDQALKEVKSGLKTTGWIWYVFPQMAGIKGTHSRPALFYGIQGRLEAFQYICHPTLRKHLVEISEAVLNNSKTVYEIFGNDAMKVRASMRLFASVSDIPVFRQIIEEYKW